MFDIGFAELLIIGVVGLLVIGPERLPGAIRTGSAWLNRFRRSFNDIKQEVQQELHNDAVLRDLRESGEKLRRETESLQRDFTSVGTDGGDSGPGITRRPGDDESPARERDRGQEDISAADQSAGHRETPAPFMRSARSAGTTAEPAEGTTQNSVDETPATAKSDAAQDREHARESTGRESAGRES